MVLLFTISSWSSLPSRYTSLSPQGVDISSVSYHILTLDMLVRTAAMPTCMRYQSTSLSHSSAADEAWYWLKCIQCSSISACTLSERCVLLVVPASDSGPHLSATPVEPTRLLVLAITCPAQWLIHKTPFNKQIWFVVCVGCYEG